MRRKGLRPGEDPAARAEDDRRGNLVGPPRDSGGSTGSTGSTGSGGSGGSSGSSGPGGGKASRSGPPEQRRPGRSRRRRRGRGRRDGGGGGGRQQERGENRKQGDPRHEGKRSQKSRKPQEKRAGEASPAIPAAPGASPPAESLALSLAVPVYPEIDPGEAPGRAAQAVVRHYLDLLSRSREAMHEYYRRLAGALGAETLEARTETWTRRSGRRESKERVVGRPRLDGDRAEVRSSGEGFGPKRFLLRRNESRAWLIEAIELGCPDCEGSGHCTLCEGKGCEVCEEGRCPACRGTGWRPYPE